MPECRCGMCKRRRRTRTRAPRFGMTGPAAAWTGTRPISSPPTSRVPPGNRVRAGAPPPPGGHGRQAAARAAIGHGPRPQPEREPPLGAVLRLARMVTHGAPERTFCRDGGSCECPGPLTRLVGGGSVRAPIAEPARTGILAVTPKVGHSGWPSATGTSWRGRRGCLRRSGRVRADVSAPMHRAFLAVSGMPTPAARPVRRYLARC